MNITGSVNWNKEEIVKNTDTKSVKPLKKTKKIKEVDIPDFLVLDKLIEDTKKYYKIKSKKEIGDILIHLEVLQNKVKNINTYNLF